MKILFSPSEAKSALSTGLAINEKSFVFENLYDKRAEILKRYDDFLKIADVNQISKLFGIKNLKDGDELRQSVFYKGVVKAVLRYDGVAYRHLAYKTLPEEAKKFIDENTMIFSNLFGPILAKNPLPEYKLKQGEKISGLNIENFYKKEFGDAIDKWLGDDDIIDLRAEFYEKFYNIKRPYTTFKFVKKGKAISHYAKAYRGAVLRLIALKTPKTTDEIGKIKMENLRLIDVKKIGPKSEILLEIT
jgi:hypothetical protein|nr:MAG TPA: Peroxide stress protein YaaA [Caudoviricetes sp.]